MIWICPGNINPKGSVGFKKMIRGMMMIPEMITEDLKSGLGLEETLVKHGTNLQQLFKCNAVRKQPLTKQKSSEVTYIYENNAGHFIIRKKVNKKVRIFGAYNSREDAEFIRDLLIGNGWKIRSVDRLCRENNIERIPGQKEYRYKGA